MFYIQNNRNNNRKSESVNADMYNSYKNSSTPSDIFTLYFL